MQKSANSSRTKLILIIAIIFLCAAIFILFVPVACHRGEDGTEHCHSLATYSNHEHRTVLTKIIPANLNTNKSEIIPKFTSTISGCAKTDSGQTETTRANNIKVPTITIHNNSINYSRSIEHQCCRKVEITNEVETGLITLTENWTGEGCRCMCFSEISATIDTIPEGRYLVNIAKQGENGIEGASSLIASQQILIIFQPIKLNTIMEVQDYLLSNLAPLIFNDCGETMIITNDENWTVSCTLNQDGSLLEADLDKNGEIIGIPTHTMTTGQKISFC